MERRWLQPTYSLSPTKMKNITMIESIELNNQYNHLRNEESKM